MVILGAGAIGGTLGAWLSPKYKNTYILDRGEVAEKLRSRGITTYQQREKEEAETIRVQSINDLSELERVDIVVLAVKNYSLDSIAQVIHDKLDENTIIVALQNGVENQRILPKYFKKIIYGVVSYKIIKASGYKECRLGGMPSWLTMTAAVKLPHFLTDRIFRKNLSKMVMSSMGQDIIQRGKGDSELESLNGYFIYLADMTNLKAPYNRAIYKLCQEEFKKTPFQPLDVEKVWENVKQEMNK